jgi:hypothetical protein
VKDDHPFLNIIIHLTYCLVDQGVRMNIQSPFQWIWDKICSHEISSEDIRQHVPKVAMVDLCQPIMSRVINEAQRNTGPSEWFDLSILWERISLLCHVHMHDENREKEMITALKCDLLRSPWYPNIIKVLLLGGAFSSRTVKECHIQHEKQGGDADQNCGKVIRLCEVFSVSSCT